MNLLGLSQLVENPRWIDRIDRALRWFGPRLEQVGRAVPMAAAALSAYLAGLRQIVIVGENGTGPLEQAVTCGYRPFAVALTLGPARQARLASLMPFASAMRPVNGAAAAYVCRGFSCRPPAITTEALERELA
jgi:uncharacterized protein YyaL (SSP411 family)